MSIQNKKPNQHFKAHYQDNAILIQFIIAELLETHYLAKEIVGIADQKFTSDSFKNTAYFLTEYLSRLLGCVPNKEHSLIAQWSKGPLTQLKHYSLQFERNAANQNEKKIFLYRYAYKAWLTAMKNLELLHFFHDSQKKISVKVSSIRVYKFKLKHLLIQIKHFYKEVQKAIPFFLENENVMFFLLKKKEQLIEVYGNEFIETIITKLKDRQLFQKLAQQYKERGHSHLAPTINC